MTVVGTPFTRLHCTQEKRRRLLLTGKRRFACKLSSLSLGLLEKIPSEALLELLQLCCLNFIDKGLVGWLFGTTGDFAKHRSCRNGS